MASTTRSLSWNRPQVHRRENGQQQKQEFHYHYLRGNQIDPTEKTRHATTYAAHRELVTGRVTGEKRRRAQEAPRALAAQTPEATLGRPSRKPTPRSVGP